MDGEAQSLTFARSPAHPARATGRSVSHPHGEARRPGAWSVRTEQRDDAHSAGHAHFFYTNATMMSTISEVTATATTFQVTATETATTTEVTRTATATGAAIRLSSCVVESDDANGSSDRPMPEICRRRRHRRLSNISLLGTFTLMGA